jgi:hypothetical protein
MTKIAFLQGREQFAKMFKPSHLEQLREIGTVLLNDKAGNPTVGVPPADD